MEIICQEEWLAARDGVKNMGAMPQALVLALSNSMSVSWRETNFLSLGFLFYEMISPLSLDCGEERT